MADKNKQAKVAALKRIGVRTVDKGEKPDPTDDTYELTIDGKKVQVPHYVYSMILAGSDDTVSFEPEKSPEPVMFYNDEPGPMGGLSQTGRSMFDEWSKDPKWAKSRHVIPDSDRDEWTKWGQEQEEVFTREPMARPRLSHEKSDLDQEIEAESKRPVEIKKYPEIDRILATSRKGKTNG